MIIRIILTQIRIIDLTCSCFHQKIHTIHFKARTTRPIIRNMRHQFLHFFSRCTSNRCTHSFFLILLLHFTRITIHNRINHIRTYHCTIIKNSCIGLAQLQHRNGTCLSKSSRQVVGRKANIFNPQRLIHIGRIHFLKESKRIQILTVLRIINIIRQ